MLISHATVRSVFMGGWGVTFDVVDFDFEGPRIQLRQTIENCIKDYLRLKPYARHTRTKGK